MIKAPKGGRPKAGGPQERKKQGEKAAKPTASGPSLLRFGCLVLVISAVLVALYRYFVPAPTP